MLLRPFCDRELLAPNSPDIRRVFSQTLTAQVITIGKPVLGEPTLRFPRGLLANGKDRRVKCEGRAELAPPSCGFLGRSISRDGSSNAPQHPHLQSASEQRRL